MKTICHRCLDQPLKALDKIKSRGIKGRLFNCPRCEAAYVVERGLENVRASRKQGRGGLFNQGASGS